MSVSHRLLITLAVLFVTLTTGCERYAVTLNERPIYTPETVYSGYRIADPALASCVKQALTEKKIEQPEQLLALNCSYAGVSQLTGIEVFSKLKTVNLSNNQLSDIKPLMFLGNLQQVNLNDNPAINCTDVATLKGLLEDGGLQANACQ